MKNSQQIIEKDRQFFAKSGRIAYYPLVIDSAKGSTLTDVDGHSYIDLLSSASALNVGHAHPKLVKAIQQQTEKLIHYTPAYMYHEPVAELAQKLVEITPGDFEKQVTFGLSGSDANDAVIKFARAYTGRPYIISFVNAYHGSTYGAISMSPISLNMRRKIGPLVPGFYTLPFPDNYRGMFKSSKADTVEAYLAPLKEMFATHVPSEEVACIVIETLQGDGGILEPVKGYFKALRQLCDEHGILLALDDVQQGLGRTGTWCSLEHFDVVADLVVYGKSLAGGLPLSALVGRKEIMESLDAPAHLFTTGANPVCCQAALATLEIIEEENLLAETTRKGEWVRNRMASWKERFDFIGDVRGLGLSIGIDLVKDRETKEPYAEAALKIANRAFEKGAVIIVLAESVLRFQPPLVITDEELEQALEILEEAMVDFANGQLADLDISGQGW